MENSIGRHA